MLAEDCTVSIMDEAQVLEALFELAGEAGMKVRLGGRGNLGEDLPPVASGVCRVRGELWVVLAGSDSVPVQIETLAGALREHAAEFVEARHMAPAVRVFLDPRGG
ncbi:MAG: hypothetical protein P8Q97_08555 [Myxococcota bacterium]|jgi:hypothetical protein|nr:hypothetical protein [Myxococcota bacterium]